MMVGVVGPRDPVQLSFAGGLQIRSRGSALAAGRLRQVFGWNGQSDHRRRSPGRGSLRRILAFKAVVLHTRAKLRAAEAQELACLRLVELGLLESLKDEPLLQGRQSDTPSGKPEGVGTRARPRPLTQRER